MTTRFHSTGKCFLGRAARWPGDEMGMDLGFDLGYEMDDPGTSLRNTTCEQ